MNNQSASNVTAKSRNLKSWTGNLNGTNSNEILNWKNVRNAMSVTNVMIRCVLWVA